MEAGALGPAITWYLGFREKCRVIMHVKEKGTFCFWKRRDNIGRAWAASEVREGEGMLSVGSHERDT